MPMLVTITVESFDDFFQTFRDRGAALRERHGSRGAQVLRHAGDEERVSLLLDWEPEAFAAFLRDPEVQASMKAGGTLGPPEVVALEPALTLAA